MDNLRLLLVADDPLVRAGLSRMLEEEEEIEVLAQLSHADIEQDLLLEELDSPLLDAIIWDPGWEVPENLSFWDEIDVPVIALVPEGIAAAEVWVSGVRALLPRDIDVEQLLAVIRTAVHGLIVLDPSFFEELLPEPNEMKLEEPPWEPLTNREKEVLQLVAEGFTNKGIAQALLISDHTVKFHVNAIMTKLGAQSRTEAVVRATRSGIILL